MRKPPFPLAVAVAVTDPKFNYEQDTIIYIDYFLCPRDIQLTSDIHFIGDK